MSDRSSPSFPFVLAGLATLASVSSAAPQHPIERASVASGGGQANGGSYYGTLSGDGRYVAFTSDATNLVPSDMNGANDVFRHDRLTGRTTRVSLASSGAEGDGASTTSYTDAISDDGRWVVFASTAANLVPNDSNGRTDIFVRDVQAGTTLRVSVGPGSREADGDSEDASISADGRRIVFTSGATNLLDPPAGSGNPQVYVHDLPTGTTWLASRSPSGAEADGPAHYPAISGDGSLVAFVSTAHNLVPGIDPSVLAYLLYVHDLATSTTTVETRSPTLDEGLAFAGYQSLSFDGRFVAFWSDAPDLVPNDTNGAGDAFLLDRQSGETILASQSSTGVQGDALIAFPRMSADGRFVAYTSTSANLVPGDTNVRFDAFVHDRITRATTRVSVAADGQQGLPSSHYHIAAPSGLSEDGRFVAFASNYRDLVPGDSNGLTDVFVVDRASPVPSSYCEAKSDSQGCLPAVAFTGTPSSSGTAPFVLRAEPVRNQRLGLLMYSLGPNHASFGGGVLCLAPPLRRTGALSSGGSTGNPDCSGALAVDFNERIRSGADPDLVPGTVVYAQFLYRDRPTGAGSELGLSDALRCTIQP